MKMLKVLFALGIEHTNLVKFGLEGRHTTVWCLLKAYDRYSSHEELNIIHHHPNTDFEGIRSYKLTKLLCLSPKTV